MHHDPPTSKTGLYYNSITHLVLNAAGPAGLGVRSRFNVDSTNAGAPPVAMTVAT